MLMRCTRHQSSAILQFTASHAFDTALLVIHLTSITWSPLVKYCLAAHTPPSDQPALGQGDQTRTPGIFPKMWVDIEAAAPQLQCHRLAQITSLCNPRPDPWCGAAEWSLVCTLQLSGKSLWMYMVYHYYSCVYRVCPSYFVATSHSF